MTHHTQKYRYTQIQIPFLHFALFASFGIHAKDTNFIFGTPHTHRNRYTQTHAHTDTPIYRYHFYILYFLAHLAYMLKILILYLATIVTLNGKSKEIVTSNTLLG